MQERTEAVAALSGIARIEATARGKSRWYVRYLWMFAAWQLVLVPTLLLWRGPAGVMAGTAANGVVVLGLSLFATRQPVTPRGYGGRHAKVFGAWGVAYAAALVLGLTLFTGSVVFAVVAALVCALPGAVAAVREARAA
ncbi:hypothetical protein BU197_10985 [Streptomyces sp. CBMA291]|nr:hypothetical protein [Streptomyces sp. CBMA291]MBD0716002.1 hypothetical protein [Streptomyces sp. CBMA370]